MICLDLDELLINEYRLLDHRDDGIPDHWLPGQTRSIF